MPVIKKLPSASCGVTAQLGVARSEHDVIINWKLVPLVMERNTEYAGMWESTHI